MHTPANNQKKKNAQAIIEYVIFIVMAALAILAVTSRGALQGAIQAKFRKNIDVISTDQFDGDDLHFCYTTQLTQDTYTLVDSAGAELDDLNAPGFVSP